MGCDRIAWVMGPLCSSSPLVGMGLANPYYTLSYPTSLGDVAVIRTVVTDTIQLEDAVSTTSQEYLLYFTSEYGIPEDLHLELPAENEAIVDFPEGKIHISQLSVIGVAKVSHFEISCRVQNIIPTLNLFRVFYVPSYNAGWMSFSKRPGKNTPQCYIKPLDSLNNWNNIFFWIDEMVFPTVVDWRTSSPRDEMPTEGTYNAKNVAVLNTYCFVSEMDLFSWIRGPHPTKVKTRTRLRLAHEVPLLEHTAGRVIAMDIPAAQEEVMPPGISAEIPPTTRVVAEPVPKEGGIVTKKRKQLRRKRKAKEVEANAPAKVLRRDHHSVRPEDHAHPEETIGGTGVGEGSTAPIPEITGTPTGSKNISDPDPLSCAKPAPIPKQGHPEEREVPLIRTQRNLHHLHLRADPQGRYINRDGLRHLPNEEFLNQYNINLAWQVAMGSQLRLRFEQEARLLRKAKAQVSKRDQRIQVKENENLGTLLEAEADMRKAAKAKNADLSKELERLRE
ncbi:hypothetical protein Tco_0553587 [Tanacetum coccineum]